MSRSAATFGVAFMLGLAAAAGAFRALAEVPLSDKCAELEATIARRAELPPLKAIAHEAMNTAYLFDRWCRGLAANFGDDLPSGDGEPVTQALPPSPFTDARNPESDPCLSMMSDRVVMARPRRLPRAAVKWILGESDLAAAVKERTLHIRCAWLPEGLDLEGVEIKADVLIDSSLVQRSISVSRATIGKDLRITRSALAAPVPGSGCPEVLAIERSTIGGSVTLSRIVSTFLVYLDYTRIDRGLQFHRMRIVPGIPQSEIDKRCGHHDGALTAHFSRVGDTIDMEQVDLAGNFMAYSLSAAQKVLLNGLRLTADSGINLTESKIDGNLVVQRLTFCAPGANGGCRAVDPTAEGGRLIANLTLDRARLGQVLQVEDSQVLIIRLVQAEVRRDLVLKNVRARHFEVHDARIGGTFTTLNIPRRTQSACDADARARHPPSRICRLDLSHVQIGAQLGLANLKVASVDLTNARVGASIAFFQKGLEASWEICSPMQTQLELRLNQARAAAIAVAQRSLPTNLYAIDMAGFRIERIEWSPDSSTCMDLGARTESPGGGIRTGQCALSSSIMRVLGAFDSRAFERSEAYAGVIRAVRRNARSLEPYQVVADALKNAGELTRADNVLFQGERHMMCNRPSILSVMRFVTTGFGYRPWWIFYWIVLFTLLGAAVLRVGNEFAGDRRAFLAGHRRRGGLWRRALGEGEFFVGRYLYFSFDHLLPIVKLRDAHYRNEPLSSGSESYFFFQRIMGYALTAGVIASLGSLAPVVR